jgi:hypothetical protein
MREFKIRWMRQIVLLTALTLSGGSLLATTTIPTTYVFPVSAVNTNLPGFIFNISEVNATDPRTIAWAEDQLAGLHGDNLADTNAVGVAVGPADAPNPSTAPISFQIPTVINLNLIGGASGGLWGPMGDAFAPDDQMPGVPGGGPDGGGDNIADEVLTYLYLPAGHFNFGVNSVEGFKVSIGGGDPRDKFATLVGEFDGKRGGGSTTFRVFVQQAGVYAARLMHYNGQRGANVAWWTQVNTNLAGGTNILINDSTNLGFLAFQAIDPSMAHAYFSKVDPPISGFAVPVLEGVHLAIVDGATPLSSSSLTLMVDNAVVTPVVAKSGNVTTIDYNISSPWALGSTHNASIAFTDGALRLTNSWVWTAQYFTTFNAAWRVPAASVDTNKPGFNWNIFANGDPGNTGNINERAELDLSLQAVDASGNLLVNNADPNAVYGATGSAPTPSTPNAPIHFEVPDMINFDTTLTNMPGTPSTDATLSGQAAEVLTYLNLPAGVVQMVVDSSVGFRLYGGAQPADVLGRAVVAENNDGSGPVQFSFAVPQAGIYPFRLIWENGSGDSHLIWYNLDSSGNQVLVNDVANGGYPAYRALTAGTTLMPTISGITPLAALHQQEVADTNLVIVLADGTYPINDSTVTLTVDGQSINPLPVKKRNGSYLTIGDAGTAFPGLQLQADVHSAVLTYKDTSGASRTQQWYFNNIQVLTNIPASPITGENFDSYPEATNSATTVPPGWTAWNFTLENTPGWDLSDNASDSYKDWVLVALTTAQGREGGAFRNDPNQLLNGQPVANFASGNVLWAQSDGRSGPQVQFCTSAPFDLSTVANPVLLYSSSIQTSQGGNAQTDGMEYSIDGGNTWHAGVIYVPIAYGAEGYIKLAPDGSVDPDLTLHAPFPATYGYWTDIQTGLTRGGDFASGLEEPVTPALAPLIAPRSANLTSSKVDGFRLPLASKQSDVRLRIYQLGDCSWWWGLDNLAFYDMAPPYVVSLVIDSATMSAGQITITWSHGGTLESSPTLVNPVWTSTGNSSGTFTAPAGSGNLFFRLRE